MNLSVFKYFFQNIQFEEKIKLVRQKIVSMKLNKLGNRKMVNI